MLMLMSLVLCLSQKWKPGFTVHGRIKVIKTLGLSKLLCNTSLLVIPEHYVKEINNLTLNFIWEGKPAKIKKKTIISDMKRGGLKMLDFEIMDIALKIAWIKRCSLENYPRISSY